MEFLNAAILSGLIYDGVKTGVAFHYEVLKSKLQDWLIDDSQMQKIYEHLEEVGVNEELSQNAIEKRINSSQLLLELIGQVRLRDINQIVSQTSMVGNNINMSGSGTVSIGNITTSKDLDS